jgi:hypothetical protein
MTKKVALAAKDAPALFYIDGSGVVRGSTDSGQYGIVVGDSVSHNRMGTLSIVSRDSTAVSVGGDDPPNSVVELALEMAEWSFFFGLPKIAKSGSSIVISDTAGRPLIVGPSMTSLMPNVFTTLRPEVMADVIVEMAFRRAGCQYEDFMAGMEIAGYMVHATKRVMPSNSPNQVSFTPSGIHVRDAILSLSRMNHFANSIPDSGICNVRYGGVTPARPAIVGSVFPGLVLGDVTIAWSSPKDTMYSYEKWRRSVDKRARSQR